MWSEAKLLNLHEQDKVYVVTEVSTVFMIAQVSSGLKKSNFLIFSKYLHAKIASLATEKSCVIIGPVS